MTDPDPKDTTDEPEPVEPRDDDASDKPVDDDPYVTEQPTTNGDNP